jgi:hypothetical protein
MIPFPTKDASGGGLGSGMLAEHAPSPQMAEVKA